MLLVLIYNMTEVKQDKDGSILKMLPSDATTVAARTQYDAISLLGDINFSNLLRRVDNHSPYRWAFMDMQVSVL
jgi:hypothetical protein